MQEMTGLADKLLPTRKREVDGKLEYDKIQLLSLDAWSMAGVQLSSLNDTVAAT